MKKYWKKNGFFLAVTLMAGILASVLASGIAIVLQKVVDVAVTKQTEAFGKLFLFAIGYILVLCVMNYTSALMEKYLTEKMIKQYRRDIFKGIMDRRPIRYYRENTADYISALTNDSDVCGDIGYSVDFKPDGYGDPDTDIFTDVFTAGYDRALSGKTAGPGFRADGRIYREAKGYSVGVRGAEKL